MDYDYTTVAVGGTFDRFHAGHRRLLEAAFKAGKRVLIGLTSDDYVRAMKKAHPVDPYTQRENVLLEFLRRRGFIDRVEVVPLHDAHGLTTTDPSLEALIFTAETAQTITEINKIRTSKKFKPLVSIIVNELLAEDEKPVSSTRIRKGEIDREGRTLKPILNPSICE